MRRYDDGLPSEAAIQLRDKAIAAEVELREMVQTLREEMDEVRRKVKNLEYQVPA